MPPPGQLPIGLSKRNDYNPQVPEKKKGSLFRLLSPRAGTSSRSEVPSLTLHVADYGSILIQCTDDAYSPNRPDLRSRSSSSHTSGTTTPTTPTGVGSGDGDAYIAPPSQMREFELAGTLEITMPPHLGKRRVRSIKIGMDATTRLDMGKTRGWEEDTIFKRRIEIRGADGAGIILEPGTQLFSFSLYIPDNMPVHDWHPNAYCGVTLFAEVEGLVERKSTSSTSRSRSRTPFSASPTSIPGTPTAGSRSASPAPGPSNRRSHSTAPLPPNGRRPSGMDMLSEVRGIDSVMSRLEEMAITPQVPAYPDGNGSREEVEALPWLAGVHRTDKPFEVLYNPNPTGGLTVLNMRILGEQVGLGGYRLELSSDIFTVCSAMQVRLTLPVPPLTTTIYAFRLVLAQTVSLYSPRDPPDADPVVTTRNFSVIDHGQIPPRGAEGAGIPTLWRGTEAGGSDFEEMSLTMLGRLPDDEKCRPTTVPQMKGPLRVSHQFIAELFFSVYGEDDRGRKLERPGSGGLRFFRVSKPVVVPSCAMIPMWLLPPTYEESPTVHPPGPCPHRPLQEDWAKDAAEYKPDLECALCRAGVPPQTRPGWRDCACGNRGEDLEERGRRLNEAPMLPGKWTVEGESLAERENAAGPGVVRESGRGEERRGRREGRE